MNDYRLYLDVEQPAKLRRLVARLSDWPDIEAVGCYYSESLYRVRVNITTSHTKPDGEILAISIPFSLEVFKRGKITIRQMLDSIKHELEKTKVEFFSQAVLK